MDFGIEKTVVSVRDFIVGLGSTSSGYDDNTEKEVHQPVVNKSRSDDKSPPKKCFNIAVHTPPSTPPISPQAIPVVDNLISGADVVEESSPLGASSPLGLVPPPTATASELDAAADEEIHQAWKWTEKYGHTYAIILGLIIVLYGHFFPRTLLVFQAIAVSGGPKLRQASHDLYHHYVRAKKAFMDEMPELEKGKALLKELAVEIASVVQKIADQNAALNDGKISKRQFETIIAELNRTMDDLKAKKAQLSGVSSSLGRIAASINPQDIEEICLSVYVCLAAAVAAVSSTVLARVAMALKIGQTISERLMNVLFVHEEMLLEGSIAKAQRDWLKAFVDTIAAAVGLYTSCYIEEKMVIFSMCSMGSKLVMDAIEALLREYVMVPLKLLETKERQKIERVCFQVIGTGVTVVGVLAHLDPRVAHLFGLGGADSLIRIVLIPFFFVESLLMSDMFKS